MVLILLFYKIDNFKKKNPYKYEYFVMNVFKTFACAFNGKKT